MSWRDAAARALAGIKTFHSSPHDVDVFDWRKARRTGEGNATYGEGTYLAESPNVSGRGGHYWNQFKHHFGTDEREAAEALKAAAFDREAAIAASQKNLDELRNWVPSEDRDPLARILGDEFHAASIRQRENEHALLTSGKIVGPRTYEVMIHGRPEEFLDWYTPMRDQPQILNRVLDQYGPRDMLLNAARKTDEIATAAVHEPANKALQAEFQAAYNSPVSRMGTFLQNMEHKPVWGDPGAKATGQQMYRSMAEPGNAAQATETLVQAGVPGIRYTDAGSRIGDPTNKTYNYVVGDDTNRLEILKKYGVVGAPAGALGATFDQSQYEAPPQ